MSEWRKRLIRLLGGEIPKEAPRVTCLKKAWATQFTATTSYPPVLGSNTTALYCVCPDCNREKP